jgi:long-subunit acyl-CoA synthetase (AMP-forming)
MFINNTKRFITRPQTTWILFQFKTRDSSTTTPSPSTKLASSYFHHASSLPFIYKTISQNFDETAAKYPDHECYVFKSISIRNYQIWHSLNILGEQKRYTFKSFKDEVDSLAASLLELGFEKNDRLAVWLPNTSENVTMTFATSKLGLIKVKTLHHLKTSFIIIILG